MITYLLTKGDNIITGGTDYPEIKKKYDKLFDAYEAGGGRPSLEPNIWTKITIVNRVLKTN
jgi:hypothetical protein